MILFLVFLIEKSLFSRPPPFCFNPIRSLETKLIAADGSDYQRFIADVADSFQRKR